MTAIISIKVTPRREWRHGGGFDRPCREILAINWVMEESYIRHGNRAGQRLKGDIRVKIRKRNAPLANQGTSACSKASGDTSTTDIASEKLSAANPSRKTSRLLALE